MRGVVPSILRQTRQSVPRARFNSTQSPQQRAQDAANKLLETSKKYINPDSIASAQKTAGKYLDKGLTLLGPVGKKAEGLLGSYKQPVTYNLSVAKELVKHVYRAEGLAPPTNVQVIRESYQTLWSRAKSPEYWREQVRTGEILRLGVLGLEAYGIFKIGEILGRRSLVGYNVQ